MSLLLGLRGFGGGDARLLLGPRGLLGSNASSLLLRFDSGDALGDITDGDARQRAGRTGSPIGRLLLEDIRALGNARRIDAERIHIGGCGNACRSDPDPDAPGNKTRRASHRNRFCGKARVPFRWTLGDQNTVPFVSQRTTPHRRSG